MRKKLLLILILSFLLSACGQGSMGSFVKDFNQTARKYETTELIENEFGEIEEEDGEKWQNIFSSNEYEIDVMYDGKKIVLYYISVKSDTDTISKDSKGYNAILTLADTLDLNIKELEKGIKEAFDDDFHDYDEGDYNIRFFANDIVNASLSVTVEKK